MHVFLLHRSCVGFVAPNFSLPAHPSLSETPFPLRRHGTVTRRSVCSSVRNARKITVNEAFETRCAEGRHGCLVSLLDTKKSENLDISFSNMTERGNCDRKFLNFVVKTVLVLNMENLIRIYDHSVTSFYYLASDI